MEELIPRKFAHKKGLFSLHLLNDMTLRKTVKEIAKMKLFLLVFGSGFRPEAGISVFVDTLPVA